jgi:hypothetical protein
MFAALVRWLLGASDRAGHHREPTAEDDRGSGI